MVFTPEIDDRIEPIIRLIDVDRQQDLMQLSILADAGDKSAILYLGLYLSENSDNTEEAMKWLLLADEFESPDAAWNIAMIARERGDADQMRRWIDRAAELGESDAKAIQANGYDVASVIER